MAAIEVMKVTVTWNPEISQFRVQGEMEGQEALTPVQLGRIMGLAVNSLIDQAQESARHLEAAGGMKDAAEFTAAYTAAVLTARAAFSENRFETREVADGH